MIMTVAVNNAYTLNPQPPQAPKDTDPQAPLNPKPLSPTWTPQVWP